MDNSEDPRRPGYASPARVKAYLKLYADLGHEIGGLELTPDRSIRILSREAVRSTESKNAYDEWKSAGR